MKVEQLPRCPEELVVAEVATVWSLRQIYARRAIVKIPNTYKPQSLTLSNTDIQASWGASHMELQFVRSGPWYNMAWMAATVSPPSPPV